MQTFIIETQHGKMQVEIKVVSDKIFDKLGIEAEKVEHAMCAIIGEKLFAMGASTERPARWDN